MFTRVDPRLATLAIQGGIRSLLLYYGPSRPVAEHQPRARQLDAPIARRRPGAGLQAGASAMIRTLIRRVIRLAILAGLGLRILFVRPRLSVAARGSLDHQGRRHGRGARGKYHQPHRRAHQATRSARGRPRDARAGHRRIEDIDLRNQLAQVARPISLMRRPTWRRRGATSCAMSALRDSKRDRDQGSR